MKLLRFLSPSIALLLLCTTSMVASAKTDDLTSPLTKSKDIETYIINQDGSFVMNSEVVFSIKAERSIKARGEQKLSYNRALETLDVMEAYTQKPDGRKVMVTPDNIKDQQEASSVNAPMFQDTRVKVIIFPEVAVDDRLIYQYKITRKTPYFPGQFGDVSFSESRSLRKIIRIYDLPETMILMSDAKGFIASVLPSEKGRKRYRWDFYSPKKVRNENGSVSYLDYGDYLAVSTFADIPALANAYDAHARDKVIVTQKIRALAAKITKDLNDPRGKALALAEWMRKNIRYVSVSIGDGGVVPHPADTILDNLYGDCKDHVTLLEALLSAVGIDSSPALMSQGNSYRLFKVAVLDDFSHAITFIPTLALYIDSTAKAVAPQYLPIDDLDKPVLLTKTGTLARTPDKQDSKVIQFTEFTINASGAADFTHSSTMTGSLAEPNRDYFRSLQASDRDIFVEHILQQYGQKGAGTLDIGALESTGDEHRMKLIGHSDNMVNLPGPIGIPGISSFYDGIAQAVSEFSSEKERSQPFVCSATTSEESARFILPKGVDILAVPKDVTVHDEHFDYTSAYSREGNAVLIKRNLRFHHAGRVCSPEEFKTMLPVIDQMLRDIRSQILVQAS